MGRRWQKWKTQLGASASPTSFSYLDGQDGFYGRARGASREIELIRLLQQSVAQQQRTNLLLEQLGDALTAPPPGHYADELVPPPPS